MKSAIAGGMPDLRAVRGAVILVGLIVSAVVSRWLVAGASVHLVYLGLGLTVAGIALAILTRWKAGLYLFLVWLTFEDLPRKYLGNNMVIYFGKDVLVGVSYLAFVRAQRRRRVRLFRPPFWIPLLLFIFWAVLEVFNPLSPSIAYGLVGLKLYFYYIPLMFLGYALIGDCNDLRRFLLFNLAIAATVAALGIAQGIMGPDFLNPHTISPELKLMRLVRKAPISGLKVYRPTSVFVSDGRFASYMLLMFLVALGTAARWLFLSAERQGRLMAWLSLGLVGVAILMSGSRGAFMYTLGSLLVLPLVLFWGTGRRQRLRSRLVRVLAWALAAVGITLLLLIVAYPRAVQARWAFYYETLAPWSPTSELLYRTLDYPVMNFRGAFSDANWPWGHGTGTNSLAVGYIVRLLGARPPTWRVESGYGTLVLEMGIMGLGLWLLWTVSLIRAAWQVVASLRGSDLFPVAFVIWWFAFLLLFPFTYGGMQPYQNYVFNAYLWLLLGILFRLPALQDAETRNPPSPVSRLRSPVLET